MSAPAVLCTVLLVVFGIAIVALSVRLQRERVMRKDRDLEDRMPIRTGSVAELGDAFRVGEFGPTDDAEVVMRGRGTLDVLGGVSDTETWILAVLARRAKLLFEFGTCTGKTAYLWARNSPPDATVVTVTLRPTEVAEYRTASDDSPQDTEAALAESGFVRFMYSGTDVERKVVQLYHDSKTLDVSPWAGRCDVVFVDGSHAYSYVLSDSRKAIELVRPGGLVLWHDYFGPKHSPGVYRGLNELARELPLVHIRGTWLVAYIKPA